MASAEGSRQKSLAAAQEACDYTRKILYIGMGNLMNAIEDPRHQKRLQQSSAGFANLARSLWPGNWGTEGPDFKTRMPEGALESLGGWAGYNLAYFGPEFALTMERLKDFGDDLDSVIRGKPEVDRVDRAAATGEKLHIGNCEEHASIAYMYLLKHAGTPRPLEIFHRPDHAFVVIGRHTDRRDDHYDPDMVICDPYYNEVYCWGDRLSMNPKQALEPKKNYDVVARLE
jgi:hypothetical protein